MDVSQIIGQLAETYSTCSTYRDTGFCFSWREHQPQPVEPELKFSTIFQRPDRLRFEWRDELGSNIVSSIGTRTETLYDSEVELVDSMIQAIAGATGVSMGTSFTVPSLLLEEVRRDSNHILCLRDLRLDGSEIIEGVNCYRVIATNQLFEDTTLWISNVDFVLRQYKEFDILSAECDEEDRELLASAGMPLVSPGLSDHETRCFTLHRYTFVAFNQPIEKTEFQLIAV